MPQALRQRAVLDGIVERAADVEAIEGLIVIGSFAGGDPDALSDLDLVAVASADRLDEAWEARHRVAGDVFLTWEPHANVGRDVRWVNWLTHDLVKVEFGVAAPGSRDLAEPFAVVLGPPSLADAFPRIGPETVRARAVERSAQQQVFDPNRLTPEQRLGWKLAEMKSAARAVLRGERDRR